jgi:acyl-CoA reductase-like NAD-dependent aldehyde dehydrogenase
VAGGEWGGGEAAYVSRNPAAPEQEVSFAPEGGGAAVEAAVEAAADAQSAWASKPGPERSAALHAWADAVAASASEWADLLVKEVGKPVVEARGEVARCVAILRYFAGEAVRPEGAVVPALAPGVLQYALRRPVGVVGLVTPWNFPYAIPLWKAAPALAYGNAVVWKPSEKSPGCAALLARSSAALPPGVFNMVLGGGPSGEALAAAEGVGAVSFTGSLGAGRAVAAACAARNARSQTEMGGKNAAVVLEDADLARAARLVAAGAVRFAGQKCTATSRAVVIRSVMEPFVEALVAALEALPNGDPSDERTAVGPLVDEAAHQRVGALVEAVRPRARWVGQGGPGYCVPPVLVAGADPDEPLAQDEIFGPVLAVVEAEDDDHAVALANRSKFGLSAAVYTGSLDKAMRAAASLEAGLVRVNGDTTGVDPHAPFGGTKASGSGLREQGFAAKEFYTSWQTVQIAG